MTSATPRKGTIPSKRHRRPEVLRDIREKLLDPNPCWIGSKCNLLTSKI